MNRYILAYLFMMLAMTVQAQKGFTLNERSDKKKVEVLYNGKLLTAYCYFDSTEKPVLFPLKTVTGNVVTRGYPIAPRAGERTDHPHHVGLWLNYESVNGLDFWNNSDAIPKEKKNLYGSIRHQKILKSKAGKDRAELQTLSHWVDINGKVLLEETTDFVFTVKDGSFIIDRSCILKAMTDEVLFKDVKDGMIALRVARALEMPSKQEDKFVDAHGNVTAVSQLDNSGVTGLYVNKEGITGDDTWSKRSVWTCLNGEKDGEKISIAIIDHPKNIGYPTYWHARGYGLFAANPLGQKVFSGGKEELNLKLMKDQTVKFQYRIIIHAGETLSAQSLNAQADDFAKTK
ncbi:MAG TPA: PmoA family protein [Ohtaekwangia sp.]|uniref:DUF6807 domain-containing protein n=1 Tax=Ohtaekwangia sp. TaxID=2066019 RepID=UPI002F91C2B9